MSSHLRALMQLVVAHLESVTGCLTIAIRLRKGDDYPFAVAHGLPAWLLTSEDSIRSRRNDEDAACSGCPVHYECLCGAAIEGRLERSTRFTTDGGSFVANNLSQDYDEALERVGVGTFRGACLRAGFESLGLVPIRSGEGTLGLIMLADVRNDMIPLAMATYVEQFAEQTAESLADLLDNLVPICANCKRIRTLDGSWMDVTSYLIERAGTRVSHTLCPECAGKLYPELSSACS